MLDFLVQVRDTKRTSTRVEKKWHSWKIYVANMRDLMLVNERLHAISQLWQMAFGLDRVQWKGSPSARLIDESANQFRVSNGDTSDQFFRSTLRENRYTTRYPPQICSHPRLLLQLPRRFIGALAKSRLLLKLIKRLLFAPLSAASS